MFHLKYLTYFCGMQKIPIYQAALVAALEEKIQSKEPASLYDPIHYILELGGKRLRPLLTLITADAFNENYEHAINAALSIEIFHNFSLIHDDIMDDAPLRRGKATVHEKWDINTGILSGDAMLIMAYQLFENYEASVFQALARLFSKTALKVCEGQQYDMDFETCDDVSVSDYLKMIEYKTAVLVGAAMKMGAIVSKASLEDQKCVYEFGRLLGVAFQLQDDYLDAFGDPETFGKQVGGDIIENKKTFLYIKAREFAEAEDKMELQHLFGINPTDSTQKIETAKQIFLTGGAAEATRQEIQNFTQQAFDILDKLSIPESKKKVLRQFGLDLMDRKV